VGTGEDITERKAAEATLKANQERIEDLNKRLRGAMAETHHRVRNNLQIISALADMQIVENRESVPVSEMRRIGSQVQALAAVHDLLTHEAKTDTGADALWSDEVIEKLVGLLRLTTSGRGIHVRADRARITGRQASAIAVIANELLVNALKNSRTDVEVEFTTEGGEGLLVVQDRGPGFPAGFDAKKSASTGLELVQQMATWDLQGSVRFENRRGGGACVCVRLPLAQTPAAYSAAVR
jgi:two-component sensor histidine kinase